MSIMDAFRSGKGSDFDIEKTDEEWKAELTADQYAVLRKESTEPPGSSPLNHEKRDGMFHCAGCGTAVYPSDTKYESGSGWPSFFAPVDGGIQTKTDYKIVMPRTEVHCASCGGHLGHVFKDGPAPTGERHCLNGTALTFEPSE